MPRLRLLFCLVLLASLTGCGLLAEKPQPAPAPPPAPAPEPPPPPLIEAPAPPPPRPTLKPRPAKPAVKKGANRPAPPEADDEPPETPPARPEPTPRAAPRKPVAPLAGPDWLQYCSFRQQSPTGILCDANTLLAQPSAKVQVYVRESALARDTPTGRIQLREGLPRLYRFFVIP